MRFYMLMTKKELFTKEIRGHTVVECINRQLCHYSYPIGQIVLLGKIICEEK